MEASLFVVMMCLSSLIGENMRHKTSLNRAKVCSESMQ